MLCLVFPAGKEGWGHLDPRTLWPIAAYESKSPGSEQLKWSPILGVNTRSKQER